MFVLIRSLTYASLFVSFLLVFLPARLLDRAGVGRPAAIEPAGVVGLTITILGGALAAWCVLTFAVAGRGTPAPFDPPRRLVVSGPYRYVRNPMYLGAVVALCGAALFYGSWALLAYALLFGAVAHLFVTLYEEPTLARTFGSAYAEYRSGAGRWLPRSGPRKARLFWPLLLSILVGDVASKHAAVAALRPPGVPHGVAGDVLRLTLSVNHGAAMDLPVGDHAEVVLGLAGLIVAAALFAWYLRAHPDALLLAGALALVIGGALGNASGRLLPPHGVVDFIDIGVGALRFWAFNIADIGITLGAALLAIHLWREAR